MSDDIYEYVEPGDGDKPVIVRMSRQSIIAEYWPYWRSRMVDKFGEDDPRITEQNCVEDWLVVHWGQKVTT